MQGLRRTCEGPYVTWTYDKLALVGVIGMMSGDLDAIRTSLKTDSSLYAPPVQKQRGRDFLALFQQTPSPLELTIDQHGSGETALIGLGLNAPRLQAYTRTIAQTIGLSPNTDKDSQERFIKEQEREMWLRVQAYGSAQQLAGMLKRPIEAVHGALLLSNILWQYGGVPESDALEKAMKQFNLPLEQ